MTLELPQVRVVTFRSLRGKTDYPFMLAVAQASNRADRISESTSLEDVERVCTPREGFDPAQDVMRVAAGVHGMSQVAIPLPAPEW